MRGGGTFESAVTERHLLSLEDAVALALISPEGRPS
jgi:hypothetical protein